MAIERETVYAEVAQMALAGLSGSAYAAGLPLVQALVDEWLSATQVDLSDMVRIGSNDLAQALQGQSPEERLVTLQNLVLTRQVQRLSGQAQRLAKSVVDQPTILDGSKADASQIATAIDQLLPQVKALADAALQKRLLRELADSDLEMRYILAGAQGIVSLRLNRYIQSKN